MEIPGLGVVTKYPGRKGWYRSQPIRLPVLGGNKGQFTLEDYGEDPRKDEFHETIANFLRISPEILKNAEPHIFCYYQDCSKQREADDEDFLVIQSPADVWQYVRLGNQPVITRRGYGDHGIYISLECGCEWEPEHGLQIVFKHGLRVNKIGPFDSHLTNSDAYDDDCLEEVIYKQDG